MNNKSICILVFTGYYLPGYKGGGPIKTIKNLFDLAGKDLNFKLITGDRDLGDTSPYNTVTYGEWNEVGNASIFYAQPGFKGLRQMSRILAEKDYDVVYFNSFFSVRFSFIPLLIAKLLHQTIILGPRGEFSEGALSLKSKKKRIFISLYKILGFHHKTVFQASSDYEAADIRRVLGPNVDIRVAEDIGAQEYADTIPSRTSAPLRAVFISRISPMKNLLAALEMLRNVQQSVHYHIYGPVEDCDYWAKCETEIAALPPHVQVEHKGELSPDDVVETIATYDVFFFPTKGENYGHVIAEALCAGLPILISDATPWRNLEAAGIGWDLALDKPEDFTRTLEDLAAMSVEDHARMRQNVLAWAKKKFSQKDALEANIDMFHHAKNKK